MDNSAWLLKPPRLILFGINQLACSAYVLCGCLFQAGESAAILSPTLGILAPLGREVLAAGPTSDFFAHI